MSIYTPSEPDSEQVRLHISDHQIDIGNWTGYEFANDYLTPASAFHFIVSDEELSERVKAALAPGARVRLVINDVAIADGHIDTVEVSASRGTGTVWSLGGRDRLGQAIDAIADPTLVFKEGETLANVLHQLFAPLGWRDVDAHFAVNAIANRDAKQGIRGTPMTKGGKKKPPAPLKKYVLHQLKPYNHESVHTFAKRITERQGLFLRCSEDGEQIVVDVPNFDQEVTYRLYRRNGESNIQEGVARFDFSSQSSVLIADALSQGSSEFGLGRIKSYIINPYYGYGADGEVHESVRTLLASRFPTARKVEIISPYTYGRKIYVNVPPRIAYLHDGESRTQDQLDNFCRREMSQMMRRAASAKFVVEGHGQIVNDQFVPWMVDTIVDVDDEVTGLSERMWVLGVHYSKGRGSGTRTSIDLIRLGALTLGIQPEQVLAEQQAKAKAEKKKPEDPIEDFSLNAVDHEFVHRITHVPTAADTALNEHLDKVFGDTPPLPPHDWPGMPPTPAGPTAPLIGPPKPPAKPTIDVDKTLADALKGT